jgi:D-alanyl-D-alanine carboxypeptidase (penicillin-binding protein 5/6)
VLFLTGWRRHALAAALLIALLAGATWFQLARPLPALAAQEVVSATQLVPGAKPNVPWPVDGIGAIGATEIGLIDASPAERQLPMFSVAKVMTALQVLADHPLKPGEQGPQVTISDSDVQNFQQRKAAQESVVDVQAGEKLTEYQLLQALLIPSGNNIADILASWDAGSVPAFVAKLNARARTMGLKQTSYADPSGVDENTKSTPSDLTRQAAVAISDPVIADIVAQPQVVLPVAGTRYNVDYSLGVGGVTGIKTGSAPGNCVFMFASPHRIAGKQVTVVGAVMGLPTLEEAFAASRKLIDFTKQTIVYDQALRAGQTVARYDVPWQRAVPIRSLQGAYLLEWPGMKVQRRLRAADARVPSRAGADAGSLEVVLGDQRVTVALEADASVPRPSTFWRLTRLR